MDAVLPPDTERIEAARQLGHDFYRFSRLPPQPAWDAAILEGFHGADARRLKRQDGDRFVRKWLQVRGSALHRDRIVDPQVTPALLMQLDVASCPILRLPLTHGNRQGSDWSVDRLNNDGAYAPHNLAIMSALANRAKASHSFQAVYGRACAPDGDSGLAPQEWMRMAVLMLGPCFVDAPGAAPILPLLTALPVSTVRSATQLIQYVLTVRTRSAADKNHVLKQFSRLCSDSHARTHVRQVAELIHFTLKTTPVMWDVWAAPGVMQAFLAWRASVANHAWAALGETAMVLAGGRHVARAALGAWHLNTSGHFLENWRR